MMPKPDRNQRFLGDSEYAGQGKGGNGLQGISGIIEMKKMRQPI
jgi:hypothetical protein